MSAVITRVENTANAAQLERIAASGLLAQGSVNTIELDAIRNGMADKWDRRKEQVWTHIDKAIEASAGDTAFYMRLNETSYLICLPDLAGAAAQSKCARILRDQLNHFLGSSDHTDIVVRNVTFLDSAQIRTVPLMLHPDTLAPQAPPPTTPIAHQPFPPRRTAPGTILSCAGPLTISFDVEHLYRIREFALAAQRIKTNVTDGLSQRPLTVERQNQLETSALAAIDMESIKFALRVLMDPQFAKTGVFVPISIQTMSNSRARAGILDLIATHQKDAAQRLVIELTNLTDGTPNGRVGEIVSYLRTRVRGVFARLTMSVHEFKALRGASLMGTIMETGDVANFSTALATNILAFGEVARAVAPALVAGPLPSEDFIDICAVAGVTHVTLQSPHVPIAQQEEKKAAAAKPDDTHRLIYASRSKLGPADNLARALDEITAQAAARNASSFVTGLLISYGGWFLQVLEGERRAVSDTLRRLMTDPRHEDIQIIETRTVKDRGFPHWSMAALVLSPDSQVLVNALEPAMRHDPALLTPESALRLLNAVARLKDEEGRLSA